MNQTQTGRIKNRMLQRFLLLFIGIPYSLVDAQMLSFNCSNDIYMRPDTSRRSWNDAKSTCRNFNATLPILNSHNQQSCFASALRYFQMNNSRSETLADVWIGGSASGGDPRLPRVWQWLDGSAFNNTGSQSTSLSQGSYYYAYALRARNDASVTFSSSTATTQLYYLCVYPTTDKSVCQNGTNQTAYIRDEKCYVKCNVNATWFGARNACLLNNGDLASSPNLSLINGIIGPNWTTQVFFPNSDWSDPYWIGLRNSWWNWTDAGNGLSTDVTLTLWGNNQPEGNDYRYCITTDSTNYNSWKAIDCSWQRPFVCQAKFPSSTSPSFETSSTKDTFTSSTSIATSTDSTEEPKAGDSKRNTEGDGNKIALGVGLGVGIGVPFLLAVGAFVALLCRRHRKGASSKTEGISAVKISELNTSPNAASSLSSEDNNNYAIVNPAKKSDEATVEKATIIDYATLNFNVNSETEDLDDHRSMPKTNSNE